MLFWLVSASLVAAQDTARYQVDVTFNWVAAPEIDAHWSRLIAFAHSSRYALFEDGATASSGLALVATNGRVSVLEAELAEGRRRGRVGQHVVLPGIASPGEFAFALDVDVTHSRMSFATMLAPSPDWFSGVSSVELRIDDVWRDEFSVELWPWDAGVDSGPDYSGPNIDTQPRQSVRLLVHPDFLTAQGLQPIGRATFKRLP
ncbi:spondin domain-containing protein [Tateyamaria omphalii]|uniref:spondin domain-containing protein n=1 Tax=Tateyamaria omphalii TaxID=299262 RepID=UPI001C9950CB|nr:spondin domain-containing protein [Tateyamaria omphalii]MBY5935232.1 spondin domain-containing protein [Tateyamaria omphalii]